MARQEALLTALIEFSDTLVDYHDVVEFLRRLAKRCAELLTSSEVGIMLADRDGTLQHVASSNTATRLVELDQLQHDRGPSLDSYRTGAAVHRRFTGDVDNQSSFARHARDAGFESVSALPLRLRNDVIGVLTLYSSSPDVLEPDDRMAAQALADIATIGILQERALCDHRTIASQLQSALASRVRIEQATGVVAERFGITMDSAFTLILDFTRSHNRSLSKTSSEIVQGDVRIPAPEAIASLVADANGSTVPANHAAIVDLPLTIEDERNALRDRSTLEST